MSDVEPVDRNDLGPSLADRFCSYWYDLADRAGGVPPRSLLDPAGIPELLPRMFVIQVLDDGDFRYRLLGTEVDLFTRRPYTGMRTSEIGPQHKGSRIDALYRKTLEMMAPMVVELPYVGSSSLCVGVRQVAAPMTTAAGGVQIVGLIDFQLIDDTVPEEFFRGPYQLAFRRIPAIRLPCNRR